MLLTEPFRKTSLKIDSLHVFSRQEHPPPAQLTAVLHQTLTSQCPAGGPQTCSDLINQHSQGNSHCLLYCLSHLTGSNEGNNCMHTLREFPHFKGTAISCHPKPTRDWDAERIYHLSCTQRVSLSRAHSNY